MSEQLKKREMKKNLGWATATSIVVGCVIGAGVFFKPYAIYQATGGAPGMGMLAWLVGGLMSIFGALTFAEVAILIPKTGGMVTYLTEAFDERLGFLAGWMQVVIFYPAFLAGYGVKVGSELAEWLPYQLFVLQKTTHGFKRKGVEHPWKQREVVGTKLMPQLDEEWSLQLEAMG